jgi:hypothetical protein
MLSTADVVFCAFLARMTPRAHCEEHLRRSNPVFARLTLDCFASLAMTERAGITVNDPQILRRRLSIQNHGVDCPDRGDHPLSAAAAG